MLHRILPSRVPSSDFPSYLPFAGVLLRFWCLGSLFLVGFSIEISLYGARSTDTICCRSQNRSPGRKSRPAARHVARQAAAVLEPHSQTTNSTGRNSRCHFQSVFRLFSSPVTLLTLVCAAGTDFHNAPHFTLQIAFVCPRKNSRICHLVIFPSCAVDRAPIRITLPKVPLKTTQSMRMRGASRTRVKPSNQHSDIDVRQASDSKGHSSHPWSHHRCAERRAALHLDQAVRWGSTPPPKTG